MVNSQVKVNKDIVLIGASTGGPKAIESVVTQLNRELNIAVLIVQHMPTGFTKSFAERLNNKCSLEVLEASDGMKIEKNKVYIAPGGYHMVISKKDVISLTKDDPMWGVRPAVDKLFISAASVYRERIISVVLTGMGKDGAEGTVAVKKNKGTTISQDEKSCIIYGMPKCAYETNCVDYVLPLNDIATKIKKIIGRN